MNSDNYAYRNEDSLELIRFLGDWGIVFILIISTILKSYHDGKPEDWWCGNWRVRCTLLLLLL